MNEPQSFESWREAVEAKLISQYCINLNDSGLDDEKLMQEFILSSDPASFVDYIARKFDLTSLSEVNARSSP